MKKWGGLQIAGAILLVSALFTVSLGIFVIRGRNQDFEKLQALAELSGGQIDRVPRGGTLASELGRWVGWDTANGIVGYDGYNLTIPKSDTTKEQLADLLTFRPILSVSAEGVKNLDDSWLAGIRDPLRMHKMDLSGTGVTDRSVEAVLEMKALKQLYLSKTLISDEAVKRVIQLPSLEALFVEGPNIRAVELINLRFLDREGLVAERVADKITAVGEVRISASFGAVPRMNICITPCIGTSDEVPPPCLQDLSTFEIGELVEVSPGLYRFQVAIRAFPAGRSLVEIRVLSGPVGRPKLVWYRLVAPPVDLKPSIPVDGVASPATP